MAVHNNGVLFEDDVLHNIFAFLDGESLIKANCCCKHWSMFLKKPSMRSIMKEKFQDLPVHIDPIHGNDDSTSGSCVWPFKTIERAERWMEQSPETRRKPKCSGLFRPFLLPNAFDFKEVRFHCHESNAQCELLQCSVGGRLACDGKVCSEHGIGWGRWIRDSVKDRFFVCFDSDAFVCQMLECKRAACYRHFSTLFRQCNVCTRSSKYAKICNVHSKQCFRYVNDDRQGLGLSNYRDDKDEWDGIREICGFFLFYTSDLILHYLMYLIQVQCAAQSTTPPTSLHTPASALTHYQLLLSPQLRRRSFFVF
jgi:hypothetical protein